MSQLQSNSEHMPIAAEILQMLNDTVNAAGIIAETAHEKLKPIMSESQITPGPDKPEPMPTYPELFDAMRDKISSINVHLADISAAIKRCEI